MLKRKVNPRNSLLKSVERASIVFFIIFFKTAIAESPKVEVPNQEQVKEKKAAGDKTSSLQQSNKFLAISKIIELYAAILGELGKAYFYNINYDEICNKTLESLEKSLDEGSEILVKREKFFQKGEEVESSLCLGFDIEERKPNQNKKKEELNSGFFLSQGKGEKKNFIKTFFSGIVCTKIYRDSPACKSGLQKGDLILKIGGIEVLNKKEEEFLSIIKKASLPLEMTIVKSSGEIKKVFFIKEKRKVRNIVFTEMLEGEIGYIKIEEFGKGTSNEFKQVLGKLKSLGASRFIIDLRGNPGGIIEELVQVLEQIVEPETVVLKTVNRAGEAIKTYKTKREIYDVRSPIVVLMDQDTASAAEIFAGVLQDLDRGVIVGQGSFGKGTIQTMRELPHGYVLKLTSARYSLPSGRYVLDDVENRPSKPFKPRHFKTKKGRSVYEIKGIIPDVIINEKSVNPLVQEALKNGAFDHYAKEFISKKQMKQMSEISLTEGQLQEAISWLSTHQEYYRQEQEVDKLFLMLNEYGYGESLKSNHKALKIQIKKTRQLKLNSAKSEIKELLEQAIIQQKFFYEGFLEYMLKKDKKIQKAAQILMKMAEYERILSS